MWDSQSRRATPARTRLPTSLFTMSRRRSTDGVLVDEDGHERHVRRQRQDVAVVGDQLEAAVELVHQPADAAVYRVDVGHAEALPGGVLGAGERAQDGAGGVDPADEDGRVPHQLRSQAVEQRAFPHRV